MKKIILFLILLTMVFSLVSCGYDCENCHDKLKIDCPDCDGKKEVLCMLCGGEGERSCVLCSGTGSKSCPSCSGMGSRMEYDYLSKGYMYKDCVACSFGKIDCPKTSPCTCIDGKVNCIRCSGRGELDCPDCSASE